jgi:hypothetical protein
VPQVRRQTGQLVRQRLRQPDAAAAPVPLARGGREGRPIDTLMTATASDGASEMIQANGELVVIDLTNARLPGRPRADPLRSWSITLTSTFAAAGCGVGNGHASQLGLHSQLDRAGIGRLYL